MSKSKVDKRNYATAEAFLAAKRHGKFRYWTNRKYKDQENLKRIKRILAREAFEAQAQMQMMF